MDTPDKVGNSSLSSTPSSMSEDSEVRKGLGGLSRGALLSAALRRGTTRYSPYSINSERPPSSSKEQKEPFNASHFVERLSYASSPAATARRINIPIKIPPPMSEEETLYDRNFSHSPLKKSVLYTPFMFKKDTQPEKYSSTVVDSRAPNLLSNRISPRKVDCGINTETVMDGTKDDKEGDERRKEGINIETQTSPQPEKEKSVVQIITESNSFKMGDYKFDKPWTLGSFDRYLARTKSKNLEDSSASSSSDNEDNSWLCRDDDDDDYKGGWSQNIPQRKANGAAEISAIVARKWECPTCCVPNEATSISCVCCTEPSPNQPKGSATNSSSSSLNNKNNSVPLPNSEGVNIKFGFTPAPREAEATTTSTVSTLPAGVSASSSSDNVDNSWLCRDDDDDDDDYKGGWSQNIPRRKENGSAEMSATCATVAKKWECPTCCVPNEATASSCVCCTEPNPNQPNKGSTTNSSSSSINNKNNSVSLPNSEGVNIKFGFTPAPVGATTTSTVSTLQAGVSASSSPDNEDNSLLCRDDDDYKGGWSQNIPRRKESGSAEISAIVAKKWECPTCCVPNEATATSCVCCTEPNPNQPKGSATNSSISSINNNNNSVPFKSEGVNIKFGFTPAPGATTSTLSSAGGSSGSSSSGSGFIFGFKPSSNPLPPGPPPPYVPKATPTTASALFSTSSTFSSGNPFGSSVFGGTSAVGSSIFGSSGATTATSLFGGKSTAMSVTPPALFTSNNTAAPIGPPPPYTFPANTGSSPVLTRAKLSSFSPPPVAVKRKFSQVESSRASATVVNGYVSSPNEPDEEEEPASKFSNNNTGFSSTQRH